MKVAIERSRRSVLDRHPGLALLYERVHFAPDIFVSRYDANLSHETDILTVVCGPGNLPQTNRREEHASHKEVEQAARVFAAMIRKVLVELCIPPQPRLTEIPLEP